MALTGIVIEKKNPIQREKNESWILVRKRLENPVLTKHPQSVLWNSSANVNTNPALKRFITFPEQIHETVMNLSQQGILALKRVKAMMVNGKFIKFADLYPDQRGEIGYHICFFIDKDKSSIITMDARTLNEIQAIGYDSYQHCRIPLVIIRITVNGHKRFTSINLT